MAKAIRHRRYGCPCGNGPRTRPKKVKLTEADGERIFRRIQERLAIEALVKKLDAVHRHPKYKRVWARAQSFDGPYEGPSYGAELKALKALLR